MVTQKSYADSRRERKRLCHIGLDWIRVPRKGEQISRSDTSTSTWPISVRKLASNFIVASSDQDAWTGIVGGAEFGSYTKIHFHKNVLR